VKVRTALDGIGTSGDGLQLICTIICRNVPLTLI
jgi:hypothetical protein